MNKRKPGQLKKINRGRIIIPVIIGLGVVVFMFIRNFDTGVISLFQFTWYTLFWLFIALILMIFRDLGYIIRLLILTENQFTFKQAFRVIMLWEFTSAITPSAIGGTSLAILYVNKEGLSVGRSSAVVMATSFLDEMYFIIMFPILLIVLSGTDLFAIGAGNEEIVGISFTNEFFYFAIIGYAVKLIFTGFLSYGLFINPRGLKWLLLWIFRLPVLRRWRQGANEAGSEIIKSSKELVRKPFRFWLKAFLATFFSWTSRYWVVNVIFMAFFTVKEHLLIFARQLVAWIMMLVSPTPGGSGFSEYVFIRYFSDFIPAEPELVSPAATVIALFWRIISYYPYLIIGVILVPTWIREKFGASK